jgi:hypothetical protein
MFRALLAHLEEPINKLYLVYCVRVMLAAPVLPTDVTRTQCTKCRL